MNTRGFRLETNFWSLRPTLCGLGWLLGLGLLLGLQAACGTAFDLPGTSPEDYCESNLENTSCKSLVEVYVNRLDSVESVLPYEYDIFDFCQDAAMKRPSENIGQTLFGEQIISSPYKLSFNKTETCVSVCVKTYNAINNEQKKHLNFLRNGIRLNYQHHWIIDSMPVTWCRDTKDGRKHCTRGFPIGCFITRNGKANDDCINRPEFNKTNTFYIFNHVDITIIYHRENETDLHIARLIAAKIEPKSYKHSDENNLTCNGPPMEISGEYTDNLNVIYTYSVKFEENKDVKWSSRWDYVLESMTNTNIQWFSITNSFVVVLFLSGLVAVVIVQALHRDITRYNQKRSSDTVRQDFGWKLLSGDVFRPPENGLLLSVFLGQGVQILMMSLITLFVACLGFLSPANRGALMTCAVVLWVLLGTPAGYVSAKMYKTFKGMKWKTHFFMTALLCPGFVFIDLFFMNMIIWTEGSSATISFGGFIAILVLWLSISVPLTLLGEYYGSQETFTCPVHINPMPRAIPQQKIFTKPLINIAVGAIVPFGCIFTQLFYILNSIWTHEMYYMFGFLFIVFIILFITCSEIAVLLCYFHLRAQDYHWWWRSFLTTSFTAVYCFIYAIHYFFTKLQITGIASVVLYLGYTVIMVLILFLFTGTIGFFSCFFFVTTIYSAVQVD
ncbi:transmembrane 9 superfamily member 2-like isoform X2 [Lepus europaeus]|uniref:transmembrane 9 superfamily member 2-like isoform X2 n=1 Tax=Lepus europaeus TaxID=9983 RepID=UPI002B4595BC|nr:transmembrane 9 superfamily member 2-like isoform X2 [Lepus europaeus]